jgi:intein/homing endonuclease
MARRWTIQEEVGKLVELTELYVRQNKTIGEIAAILGIAYQSVYDRLIRLGIPTTPKSKASHAARLRSDIIIPTERSPELAEFFGIMLGDGHVAPYQVMVTLGTKELAYARHISDLMHLLFGVAGTIFTSKRGYHTVYIGSRELVLWLKSEGLANSKVRAQVGVPTWVYEKPEYMVGFLRGFFDTDGSVYELRFGIQMSFVNRSLPLLNSVRDILIRLGYHPSMRTGYNVYLTQRDEIARLFLEVEPANKKHQMRFALFALQLICAGVRAVK